MENFEIAQLRLRNQHLIGKPFQKPEEAVSWLGAVQAQDFPAAKWALGLRTKKSTDETIEQAFNKGKFLRTHVLRPTWHFVAPEDIRWMLKLTGPNITRVMSSYNKKLELSPEVFAKSHKTIKKTLPGKHLVRADLKKALADVGINTDVQRLAHLVMQAELDGLICSGPKIGKQLTYQLLEERVPKAKELNRDEALAELTLRYFKSHGPAQVRDFSWWSGLPKKDVELGLNLVGSKLIKESIDNKVYWFSPEIKVEKTKDPRAFLLSIYDEYTIAYNDRSVLGDGRYFEKLISMGNALTSVIILDSKVVGTWKRSIAKKDVKIKLSPLRKLSKNEQRDIEASCKRYGQFLNLQPKLIYER